jgi:hypothetical protein
VSELSLRVPEALFYIWMLPTLTLCLRLPYYAVSYIWTPPTLTLMLEYLIVLPQMPFTLTLCTCLIASCSWTPPTLVPSTAEGLTQFTHCDLLWSSTQYAPVCSSTQYAPVPYAPVPYAPIHYAPVPSTHYAPVPIMLQYPVPIMLQYPFYVPTMLIMLQCSNTHYAPAYAPVPIMLRLLCPVLCSKHSYVGSD